MPKPWSWVEMLLSLAGVASALFAGFALIINLRDRSERQRPRPVFISGDVRFGTYELFGTVLYLSSEQLDGPVLLTNIGTGPAVDVVIHYTELTCLALSSSGHSSLWYGQGDQFVLPNASSTVVGALWPQTENRRVLTQQLSDELAEHLYTALIAGKLPGDLIPQEGGLRWESEVGINGVLTVDYRDRAASKASNTYNLVLTGTFRIFAYIEQGTSRHVGTAGAFEGHFSALPTDETMRQWHMPRRRYSPGPVN